MEAATETPTHAVLLQRAINALGRISEAEARADIERFGGRPSEEAAEIVAAANAYRETEALLKDGRSEGEGSADRLAEIRKGLFEDSEDVWTADAEQARIEIPGSCGLFWKGQPTQIFAPREAGKTTTFFVVGVSMAAAGVRVLYLDRENGGALMKEKLDEILAAHPEWDLDTVRENLVVRSWPILDPSWSPDDYAAAVAGEGFEFVFYDNTRELFDQLGGVSTNSESDWSAVWTRVGSSLLRRGVTTAFFDNTGHKNLHRAGGTAAKANTLTQGYRVATKQHFSREVTGRAEIVCTRSRLGFQHHRWVMTLGGGVFDLPTQEEEPTTETTDDKILRELTADWDDADHETERAAEGLGEGWRKAATIAKNLGVDMRTLMRRVEHLNTPPEHDSDDEDWGEFTPPIAERKKAGKPTWLRDAEDAGRLEI